MFIGEFKQTIDDKGKLVLPRAFSPGLAVGIVVTRGFERNLMIFARQDWHALAEKVLQQSLLSSESRILRRRLFANAVEIEPDRNGRIKLPASLCGFAEIEGDVVLAGMYDFIEIWSENRWAAVNSDLPFTNIAETG